jgi:hypothetical protein
MLVSFLGFSWPRVGLTRVDTEHGSRGNLKAISPRFLGICRRGRGRPVAEAVDAAREETGEFAEAVLGGEVGEVCLDGHGQFR